MQANLARLTGKEQWRMAQWAGYGVLGLLGACSSAPLKPDTQHLQQTAPPAGTAAPLVDLVPLSAPKPAVKAETYSVVVNQVPVEQILFALARDARVNVDIRPGLAGNVTLNAINQTLPQLLERLSEQVDMRYEIRGNVVSVGPDTPELKTYHVDYVNVSRKAKMKSTMSASVSSSGGEGSGVAMSNASSTEIETSTDSDFWKTLKDNLENILQEEDKVIPLRVSEQTATASNEQRQQSKASSSGARGNPEAGENESTQAKQQNAVIEQRASTDAMVREAKQVILNPETGLVLVRAKERVHKKIAEFLTSLQRNAGRQVLIEATLVEVLLDDNYQAGVDWSRVGDNLNNSLNISQSLTGNSFSSSPVTTLTFASTSSLFKGTFNATMKLLESFGKTRVLSSPKVMALNNQPALLKVVDEKVYFEISATRVEGTDNQPDRVDYTSTIKSVPVGMMMSVTPQINRDGLVLLNVRPTITRITGYKSDPAPTLMGATVDNLIPEIQVREIESTLKLASGQTAVLGGLMQEAKDDKDAGIPVLMHLPWIGNLFTYKNNGTKKSELVIFLRPTVVENPGLDGDLGRFREHLPGADFFDKPGLKPAGSLE